MKKSNTKESAIQVLLESEPTLAALLKLVPPPGPCHAHSACGCGGSGLNPSGRTPATTPQRRKDKDIITIRDLRALLFDFEQSLSVLEIRRALFEMPDQEKAITKEDIMAIRKTK